MKKVFIKNFVILSLSTIVINAIELVTNAYITQKIGTTVLGTYSLIMNMFTFLITICMCGIPLAINKIISESAALNDSLRIRKTTTFSISICAILSLVVSSFTIIFRNKLNTLLLKNMVDEKVVIFLALSLPFMCISACFCEYFNALRKVNKTVYVEFVEHFLKNFLVIFLISKKVQTYFVFAVSLFICEVGSFLTSLTLYILDKKNISSRNMFSTNNFNILKRIFKISLPIAFTSIVRSALSTLKHTLIPVRMQYFGYSYAYALSRYGLIHGIALPFILMPSFAITNFASLLLPEFARYYALKDTKKIQSLTNKVFRLVIFVSLYFSFVIYTTSDYICFKLYKDLSVSYYVKVLTPLIVIMYLDFVVDSILRGLDLQTHVMKINIIDVILSITLIYFAIPRLGSFGYILVIYVSEYFNGIMSLNALLKVSNIQLKYSDLLLKPLIFFFMLFFVILVLFKDKMSLMANLEVIAVFTLGSLIYYFIDKKRTISRF